MHPSLNNHGRARPTKRKSERQRRAELEHKKFLLSVGVKGPSKVSSGSKLPDYSVDTPGLAPCSNSVSGGVAAVKEAKVYSGERRLIGIATMHKSNMVPVFDQKTAIEISKMRRG